MNNSTKFNFNGKKVLITGAARGIGHQIALKIHEFGAEVIALDKSLDGLKILQSELNNDRIQIVHLDLHKSDSSTFEHLLSPYLPVHYLVNNAGILLLEDFLDMKSESFDHIYGVNFKSALFLTQHIAKDMINHNIKGSIVNMSSQASYTPCAGHMSYGISKASLDYFTRMAAWELGPKGIRVNAVNPTVVPMTDMTKGFWSDPTHLKEFMGKIPLGRFAELDDVVNAVLFLLSEDSRMITGVRLPVDGGASTSSF